MARVKKLPEDHGEMVFQRADIEGYLVLKCPHCLYEIAVRHDGKKVIREGNSNAAHSASVALAEMDSVPRVSALEAKPTDGSPPVVH